jgi:hypothetical protein
VPYWTRATVHERAVQLTADIQQVGLHARGLGAQAYGGVDIPPEDFSDWEQYARSLIGPKEDGPTLEEEWKAVVRTLPRADDLQLAEARQVAQKAYEGAHLAVSMVEPFVTVLGVVGVAARVLRLSLAGYEDESHRLIVATGDLRRSERRQR